MAIGSDGVPFTMPVEPANSGSNNNNGWGGDWGAWIILFLIFGMFGWGGFGGWGGGFGGGMNGGVGSEVQRGFDHSSVVTKLDGITQGICDSTYALNNTMTTGFSNAELSRCNQQAALMQQLFSMQMQDQNCCCETREAVQGVNYNLATQACDTRNTIQNTTRDIIDNQNSNTRAILDFLVQDKLATKDARITALENQLSQANQNAVFGAKIDAATAELLRRTGHDCPSAAYIVQPPTPVNFPTNCCGTFNGGWGNGCGNCCG